jgi:hypothetical protein
VIFESKNQILAVLMESAMFGIRKIFEKGKEEYERQATVQREKGSHFVFFGP